MFSIPKGKRMENYKAKSGTVKGLDTYLDQLEKEEAVSRQDAPFRLLSTLQARNGSLPVYELAKIAGMDSKTFVSAINKTYQKNLITLNGAADDPENVVVSLTATGIEFTTIQGTL
jgi:DNA-binding MarR family transcriptional regulator